MKPSAALQAAPILIVLLLWEICGRLGANLPGPSAIWADMAENGELYAVPFLRTARLSALGLGFGAVAAILASLLFCRIPWFGRLMQGVNITLFAMPAIIIGPILALFFKGAVPEIVTAAILVYFPVMTAMALGLSSGDQRLMDLVKIYHGGSMAEYRFVRLPAALPALFAGLKAAAPLAVLGVMLAESGGGGFWGNNNWGLGDFLLASLGQANPERLWGIGAAGAILAMIFYGFFALCGAWFGKFVGIEQTIYETRRSPFAAKELPATIASILLPFCVWGALVAWSGVSPIIAPGPVETIGWLIDPPDAEIWPRLGVALSETLPAAFLGLAFGLAAAFILAILLSLAPVWAKGTTSIALIMQSMPLVVLAPLIFLLFGRDLAATVITAVLVVFFPAYSLLTDGFRLIPQRLKDVVRLYGGGRWQELRFVALGYAAPYGLAAIKLTAPRAILGVMVAEWLLSGKGLGNLLNVARAEMDSHLAFAAAMVSILVSLAACGGASSLERWTRRAERNR